MKHYTYLLAVSLGLFLTSCADDLTENLAVQNVPLSVQVMEELNSLDPLKSYKTASNISPNFKLGAALKASDLAAGGNVSALAAANFDEVVDADIMQYAACVGEDGTMNFSGVTDFVETARKAGVGVYGQSLVSHRNQQVAYLSKLIADREPSTEDLVPIEKPYDLDLITNSDCEGNNENYYANDPTEGISTDLSAVADDPVQGKCMVVNSADQAVYSWDSQFFIKVDHAFKAGEKAKLTMKIKADVAQSADGCQAHGDKPGAYKHWAFFANPDFTT
ncbi:MAG: endo-1,4-beta-xylanase, partial [Bacteroidales bacterium]|nr:endo-1,4-beta-xylanase [Bacteroidales bacterium]